MDVGIDFEDDVAAAAAGPAVRPAAPVENVAVEALAAVAAVTAGDVDLRLIYEHYNFKGCYFSFLGTTLTTLRGSKSTFPPVSANRVWSLPTPTLRPGLKLNPRCFRMIAPAFTTSPMHFFTPNPFGWLSLPFTTCAIWLPLRYLYLFNFELDEFAPVA